MERPALKIVQTPDRNAMMEQFAASGFFDMPDDGEDDVDLGRCDYPACAEESDCDIEDGGEYYDPYDDAAADNEDEVEIVVTDEEDEGNAEGDAGAQEQGGDS